MELQQLRYFQTVAQLGHMTRAAEALYVAQPSLSRAIARLEQELGAPLFERRGRRIYLNDFGRVFLRHVEFAFEELEQGKREIADLVGPEQGVVTLSVVQGLGAFLLPGLLGAFRQGYPAIRFQVVEGGQEADFGLLRRLEEGEFDVCFCPEPREIEPLRVDWQPVMTMDVFLAVAPGHRLAGRERIQLAEVAAELFLCLRAGTGFRAMTNAMCEQAGFKPDVVVEVDEFTVLRELVMADVGVAIVPGLVWQDASVPVPARLTLEEETQQWTIGVAWGEMRYQTAAARLFRGFAEDYFALEK